MSLHFHRNRHKMSQEFFLNSHKMSQEFRHFLFLCMSFYASAQKEVIAFFALPCQKMFQDVGSRAFLRPSNALKMTIPDLVRKCKRDILPLENVSKIKAHFFLHRSLQDTRGSKGSIPFLIEVSQETVFRGDTPP